MVNAVLPKTPMTRTLTAAGSCVCQPAESLQRLCHHLQLVERCRAPVLCCCRRGHHVLRNRLQNLLQFCHIRLLHSHKETTVQEMYEYRSGWLDGLTSMVHVL